MTRLALEWRPLEPPRVPVAVIGEASVARSLAAAALRSTSPGEVLRVAASDDLLLVVGEPEDLPWADGATYLGREAGLLLPTTLAPTVPADLLHQAARRVVPSGQLVVLPGRLVAFSASAGAVDPGWLEAYARGGLE